VDRNVASSTQDQAKSALPFLYCHLFGVELPWLGEIVGAEGQLRLPVVLTPVEVRALLQELSGTMGLVAALRAARSIRSLQPRRLYALSA